MEKIKVIKEPTSEKPFLVIWKPKGLPSAPLNKNDSNNAVVQAAELFEELKKVQGRKEIELGLLHRLDTATDGLLLIAATQECYDFLLSEQRDGRFIKTYTARCDIIPENAKILTGFPEEKIFTKKIEEETFFTVESFFRPYGKHGGEVRPVTEKSGTAALKKIGNKKLYKTEIKITGKTEYAADAECTISQGFRHQVRCHLAWAGLPVQGDFLYNSQFKNILDKKNAEKLMFSATKISFYYPRGDLNSYDRKDTWT